MLKTIVGTSLLLGGLSALAIASLSPDRGKTGIIVLAQTHDEGDSGTDGHGSGRRGGSTGGHDDGHTDDGHTDDGHTDDGHTDDGHTDDGHGEDSEGRGKGPKFRGGRGVADTTTGSGHSLEDRVLRIPLVD